MDYAIARLCGDAGLESHMLKASALRSGGEQPLRLYRRTKGKPHCKWLKAVASAPVMSRTLKHSATDWLMLMIRRISVILRVSRIVSFVTGRVATGWPHLHSIVHPHIIILPGR
eukprot:3409060-Pleurochrysis_carterae.AAC.1